MHVILKHLSCSWKSRKKEKDGAKRWIFEPRWGLCFSGVGQTDVFSSVTATAGSGHCVALDSD